MRIRAGIARRLLLFGTAAFLVARKVSPAHAATVSATTTDLGSKVRVYVKITGSASGINFGSQTFGPIDVPKDGTEVVRTFNFANAELVAAMFVKNLILTLKVTLRLGGIGQKIEAFIGMVRKKLPF